MITVNRTVPVVLFLERHECILTEDNTVNCFHFGANSDYAKSPEIPAVINGIRVPMVLDTGAEVTIVSTKFMKALFPDRDLRVRSRRVRFLSEHLVIIQGPITLTLSLIHI